MTLFVSDVHGAFGPLGLLLGLGEPVVILGDMANLSDYRSGEGALADVLGLDFARAAATARAVGDYPTMRSLWSEHAGERLDEVRKAIGEAIVAQYHEATDILAKGHGWMIHGNVDHPDELKKALPKTFTYLHGDVIEVDGLTTGFVGGGVSTPLNARGEITDEVMTGLLDSLGPVEVLCTHVPPAVRAVRHDVITGREERGSKPILDYLNQHQPRYHLYGDVHQPQATTWRVGSTRCMNAGYFRATGRFLRLEAGLVQAARIG